MFSVRTSSSLLLLTELTKIISLIFPHTLLYKWAYLRALLYCIALEFSKSYGDLHGAHRKSKTLALKGDSVMPCQGQFPLVNRADIPHLLSENASERTLSGLRCRTFSRRYFPFIDRIAPGTGNVKRLDKT